MTTTPEHWFYHLERSGVSEALAPLLEKTLQRGWRALVRSLDTARLESLDDALWTYRDASFLPHGRDDGARPERQPVLLTVHDENPNEADVVFLLDGAGAPADLKGVERVVVLFDGGDAGSVQAAREMWKRVAAGQGAASYWRQNARGGWEKAG